MSDRLPTAEAQLDQWVSVNSVGSYPGRFRTPRPLPSEIPTVPELRLEILPPALAPWIEDSAERMQVPPEFIAVPAIISAASVVGRAVAIQPKARDSSWRVVPNLWGGVVAAPGLLKSPALAAGLDPVRRLETEARNAHEAERAQAEARVAGLEARINGAKDKLRAIAAGRSKDNADPVEVERELAGWLTEREGAEAVTERRFVVSDTTTEKLGELLIANPRGLLLVRDELAGWLRNLDRDDRRGDREFYLEAWNGSGAYRVDRIKRGSLYVPALTVSVVGGIQPGKIKRYVAEAVDGGTGADGLLQRLQLAIWPDTPRGGWRLIDRPPNRQAEAVVNGAFERLASIEGETVARFEPAAQELFNAFLADLERRLRDPAMDSTPALTAHLAKYRSLMPSLSLVFGLLERAKRLEIPLDCARRAAAACEFLEAHARRLYAPETGRTIRAARTLAELIRGGEVEDGMTLREVYRRGRSGLKTPDDMRAAVAVLAEHGWTEIETTATGAAGRPSERLRVNPEALS